jgi:hypothetical protein
MTKQEQLLHEIKEFPDDLLDETIDFVQFLKTKMLKSKLETAIISESSLKKDWMLPEEDDIWRNL